MHPPSFKLTIRRAFALILLIALGLALFVRNSSYRSVTTKLDNELRLKKSNKQFKEFMDSTFDDLGSLILKEPQEVLFRVLTIGEKKIDLYQIVPKDLLSRISAMNSKKIPNSFAKRLYDEFTSVSVDDQSSYYDPVPVSVLEFTRNGETVLMFSGKENGINYVKILVMDTRQNRKNTNYGWFRFDSTLIDKVLTYKDRD